MTEEGETMTKKHQELSVELNTILQYLLNKLDPTVQRRFRLDYGFKFLGYLALHPHKDLLDEYCEIDFNPWNALETLNAYKRLFTIALERGLPEKVEYAMRGSTKTLDPSVCKAFFHVAADEGGAMLISADYEFLSVFLLLCALGLGSDPAALKDFEHRIGRETRAEAKIQLGLEAITKTLTLTHTN
jgi:hypothetical protein